MPFDFDEYEKKCQTLTTEQLHKEWENYTRQIAGGATSTATSVLFSPFTAGISLIGLGLSAPRIHNARKKRQIIEAGLNDRGTKHTTRKRDVIAPVAMAGTFGGLTLGLAGPGADMIAGAVVGHGVEYAAVHVALDSTGAVLEHTHDEHEKKKAAHKLEAQYQAFQQQFEKEKKQGAQPTLDGKPDGTPGVPPYQPATPGQDYKYEYVPIPAADTNSIAYQANGQASQSSIFQPTTQSQYTSPPPPPPPPLYQLLQAEKLNPPAPQPQIIYQPASHQPQFAALQPQTTHQPSHHVPQAEKSPGLPPVFTAQAGPIDASYFPEESGAYVESIPKLGQDAPMSSQSVGTLEPDSFLDEEDSPPALSMEDEIAFLKFKLLQMELEKRGEKLEVPPLTVVKPQSQPATPNLPGPAHFRPELLVSLPTTSQAPQQQNYPLPPASPAPPPRPISVVQPSVYPLAPPSPALPPRPLSVAAMQYMPPPPPPPLAAPNHQTQYYPPPPPLPSTYNPQHYPLPPSQYQQPPKSPSLQQPQPQYQRHDSGYYSSAPTPMQQYAPPQPVSAQSTGQQYLHSRNPSQVSLSPLSPPPPYLAPPPATAPGRKDYFPQPAQPPIQNYQPQQQQGYSSVPTQPYQGGQGWMWGVPAQQPVPGQMAAEANYGPPPPIPAAWRGS